MVACRWLEQTRPADELARGVPTHGGNFTPASQIFALVCMLYEDDLVDEVRARFEKRTNIALDKQPAPSQEANKEK